MITPDIENLIQNIEPKTKQEKANKEHKINMRNRREGIQEKNIIETSRIKKL